MPYTSKPGLSWLIGVLVAGCTGTETVTPTDPLPMNFWTASCTTFAPITGGFQLAECCQYFLMPLIKLNAKRQFSTPAVVSRTTAKGIVSKNTTVNGVLSADGKTLTIAYDTGLKSTIYTLELGVPRAICDCACY